jgi:chromate transporter
MLKIGLFTFGGGYAMIALLENEFVTEKKWLDGTEFLDMVAIAESTPGPIAINAATWIGYRLAGFLGALVATVAICIPSFVIIYLIALFFDAFLTLTVVAAAFKGIRVGVIFMILTAGLRMLKKMKKKPLPLILMSTAFAALLLCGLFAMKISAVFFVLAGAVVGITVHFVSLAASRPSGHQEDKA